MTRNEPTEDCPSGPIPDALTKAKLDSDATCFELHLFDDGSQKPMDLADASRITTYLSQAHHVTELEFSSVYLPNDSSLSNYLKGKKSRISKVTLTAPYARVGFQAQNLLSSSNITKLVIQNFDLADTPTMRSMRALLDIKDTFEAIEFCNCSGQPFVDLKDITIGLRSQTMLKEFRLQAYPEFHAAPTRSITDQENDHFGKSALSMVKTLEKLFRNGALETADVHTPLPDGWTQRLGVDLKEVIRETLSSVKKNSERRVRSFTFNGCGPVLRKPPTCDTSSLDGASTIDTRKPGYSPPLPTEIADSKKNAEDIQELHHRYEEQAETLLHLQKRVEEGQNGQRAPNAPNSNIQELERELQTKSDELAQKNLALEIVEKEAKQDKERREDELKVLNQELKEKDDRISVLEGSNIPARKLEKTEKTATKFKNKAASLKKKLKEAKSLQSEKDSKISKLEADNASARQDHQKKFSKVKNELEAAKKRLRSFGAGDKEEIATLKEKLESSRKRARSLDDCQTRNTQLRSDLEAANKRICMLQRGEERRGREHEHVPREILPLPAYADRYLAWRKHAEMLILSNRKAHRSFDWDIKIRRAHLVRDVLEAFKKAELRNLVKNIRVKFVSRHGVTEDETESGAKEMVALFFSQISTSGEGIFEALSNTNGKPLPHQSIGSDEDLVALGKIMCKCILDEVPFGTNLGPLLLDVLSGMEERRPFATVRKAMRTMKAYNSSLGTKWQNLLDGNPSKLRGINATDFYVNGNAKERASRHNIGKLIILGSKEKLLEQPKRGWSMIQKGFTEHMNLQLHLALFSVEELSNIVYGRGDFSKSDLLENIEWPWMSEEQSGKAGFAASPSRRYKQIPRYLHSLLSNPSKFNAGRRKKFLLWCTSLTALPCNGLTPKISLRYERSASSRSLPKRKISTREIFLPAYHSQALLEERLVEVMETSDGVFDDDMML